jgi:hypothetical protein
VPFKFIREDKHHFVAHNGKAEILIAKRGLSPSNRTRYRAMCKGGVVKKMAEGGQVEATGSSYGNQSGIRMPTTGFVDDSSELDPGRPDSPYRKPLEPWELAAAKIQGKSPGQLLGGRTAADLPPNTSYPGNVRSAQPGEEGDIDWGRAARNAPALIGNAAKKAILDPIAGAAQGLAGMDYTNVFDPLVAGVRSATRRTPYAEEKARVGEAWGRPGNVEKDPRQDPEAYDKFAMHLFNAGAGLGGGGPRAAGAGLFGAVAGETPAFYSTAERALQAAQRKQGNAQAWLNDLAKAGVKKEELQATGLDRFLTDREFNKNIAGGANPITREEVAEYLARNKIEPRTMVLGGPGGAQRRPDWEQAARAIDDRIAETHKELQAAEASRDVAAVKLLDSELAGLNESRYSLESGGYLEIPTINGVPTIPPRPMQRAIEALDYTRNGVGVRGMTPEEFFSRKADPLAGLSWDEKHLLAAKRHLEGQAKESLRYSNTGGVPGPWERQYLDAITHLPEAQKLKVGRWTQAEPVEPQYESYTLGGHKPGSYHEILFHAERDGNRLGVNQASPHFGETGNGAEGLIAHARVSEHADATGKPLLMVEEIQSDLHQQGRTSGYVDAAESARLKRESLAAAGALSGFKLKMKAKYGGDVEIMARKGDLPMTLAENRQYQALADNFRTAETAWEDIYRKIPDIPWKGGAHEDLVAKRLLRHAAEQGYDKVAWTTGEQQAARYSLASVVDKLSWKKHQDPTTGKPVYSLTAYHPEGGAIEGHGLNELYTPERLPQIIGKDLTDEILKSPHASDTLRPADLKLGGKGMKAAYDERLPAIFQKLVKKYGGTVQQEMTGGPKIPRGILQDADALSAILRREGYSVDAQQLLERPQQIDPGALGFLSGHVERSYLGAYDRLYRSWEQSHGHGMKSRTPHTVWTVTIPEAAKKAMLKEGFPSFAKGGIVGGKMHLAKEDEGTLHVARPDGTTVIFAKSGLTPDLLAKLQNLPRLDQEQIAAGDPPVQHMAEGGFPAALSPTMTPPVLPSPYARPPNPWDASELYRDVPPPAPPEAPSFQTPIRFPSGTWQDPYAPAPWDSGKPDPAGMSMGYGPTLGANGMPVGSGITPDYLASTPNLPVQRGMESSIPSGPGGYAVGRPFGEPTVPEEPGTLGRAAGPGERPFGLAAIGDIAHNAKEFMFSGNPQYRGVGTEPVPQPGPTPGAFPAPVAGGPAEGGGGGAGAQATGPQLPHVPDLNEPDESVKMVDKANQQQSEAHAAMAKAQEAMFNTLADQAKRTQQSLQTQIASNQEYMKAREAGGQQLFQEIMNKQIDPRHFFELKDEKGNGTGKEDTWLKIRAGIGMLFSGIGSGLTGQPNLAYQIIDKAIERDIDAQKTNLHKMENAYSYYLAQTHQDLAARQLVKADLLTAAASEAASLEAQGKAAMAGPNAQLASATMMANAASLRSSVLLQANQRTLLQYDLNYKQFTRQLLTQAMGWRPGTRTALEGPERSEFVNTASIVGVPGFESDKVARESVLVPVMDYKRDAKGQPIVDPRTGKPTVVQGTVYDEFKNPMPAFRMEQRAYAYDQPTMAAENQKEFAKTTPLIQATHKVESILNAHPAGLIADLAFQERAVLQAQLFYIKSAFESDVANVRRQPNAQVISLIDQALKSPGGFFSSTTGSSLAAIREVRTILENHVQSLRSQARY